MPNPKRRHSKTRGRKRRTHDALTAATAGRCPQCGEPKAAHRVCAYCGHYRARQVRPVDEE
ncbi:MAG: 50S ribosomal protein L32 [Vicinamibacterales bacterium]|jgi:large subunit ribosomal protein L32|nr:50S ribosomal protein L32 [Acidobacteriota bacterium]MCC7180047.1 50S ribosomal protein L32 [Acidobacteriota bacterium]